jgi:probable HAF family extracellular repeat protein
VVRTTGAVRTFAGTASLVVIVAVAATVGAVSRVGAASTFRTTDLGTLGGDWSQATALNDSGQVVGWGARAAGQPHAFSWTSAGGMVDLGTLGGATSFAAAVNSHGVVVGYADTANGATHAFSWTSAGGMVDLGALGGTSSAATAINNDGVIVGHADVASGSFHAFRWTPGDPAMTDLGTLGGDYSAASDVNDTGQVVGYAADGSGLLHAASWPARGAIVNVEPARYSAAVAVNSAGQVVGFEYSPDFSYTHAFSWASATGLTDIGSLGGKSSGALAVNDAGEVVGWANSTDGSQHAFSWTSGTGISDLNPLGTYGAALRLNGAGQIVGYMGPVGSPQHAFTTDPDDGHLVDLGTLGGAFSGAVDVNATGQVAGFASAAGGSMHATLFSPPTLYERVQEVAAGLPLAPHRFVDANGHLQQALDPSSWDTGGTALSYPDGMQFFDRLKETIDQLDKVPNSAEAQRAIADLWAIADQLATRSVADAASTTSARPNDVAVAQRQLTSAEARWSVNHTDALERLKQAWRSAEGAVR